MKSGALFSHRKHRSWSSSNASSVTLWHHSVSSRPAGLNPIKTPLNGFQNVVLTQNLHFKTLWPLIWSRFEAKANGGPSSWGPGLLKTTLKTQRFAFPQSLVVFILIVVSKNAFFSFDNWTTHRRQNPSLAPLTAGGCRSTSEGLQSLLPWCWLVALFALFLSVCFSRLAVFLWTHTHK